MINLINITKTYGDKTLFKNFTATFPPGVTTIMAPSGRGKTTLANIITGLVTPDEGQVVGTAGKNISYVFQDDRLLEREDALTNLLFVVKNNDIIKATRLLEAAGLKDSLNKKVDQLSGGMKRRVALCRGLMPAFDILILDEPFKGLDSKIKPKIMDLVKKEARGKVVIFITHDIIEATYMKENSKGDICLKI